MRFIQSSLVVLSCLILASCSCGSGNSSSGANSSSGLSCDVAPADEMGSTLGQTGLQNPASKTTQGVLVCSYATAKNSNAVILRMRKTGESGFEVTRKGFEDTGITTVNIDGLGKKAFSASNKTGAIESNTVVAWDGTVEVQISTTGSSVEAVTSMLAKVLTRLGS